MTGEGQGLALIGATLHAEAGEVSLGEGSRIDIVGGVYISQEDVER